MRVGDDVKLGFWLLIGAGVALVVFYASLRSPRRLPESPNWRWLLACLAVLLAVFGIGLIVYRD